jgi:hypothetical protein
VVDETIAVGCEVLWHEVIKLMDMTKGVLISERAFADQENNRDIAHTRKTSNCIEIMLGVSHHTLTRTKKCV